MSLLRNLGITCFTLVLLYAVLEYASLPLFFHLLPPATFPLIDDGLPVLLQKSNGSVIPHHYIALAGDSYAMGLGDDYYHEAGNAQARYGSAPVLREATGHDVISFGSAGNGSIAGIVARPLATLAYLRASTRIQLTDPDILLIYFYEGNDLNDNIEYLQKQAKSGKPFDNSQLQDHAYFQHYLNQSVLQQEALYQRSIDPRWYQQLYLGKFIVHASAALAVNLPHLIDPEKKDEEQAGRSPLNPPGRYSWTEPGHINHARINDSDVSLPDTVQGPSMDLDEQEKNDALVSFRESLHFLKQALPNTRVVVVYLPSVISCYAITSPQVSVQSHARRHHFVFDTPQMREQSDWIALQIGNVSRSEQAGFIDAREAIRSAAQREPVHGPLDWNHFNQAGYKALASAIIPDLKGWLATP